MSTRAIIRVEDGDEVWSLYCHGDGYPDGIGQMVKEFAELAPKIDPNNSQHEKLDFATFNYDPYKFVPNVSLEACKFACAMAGHLWKEGYCHAYLTTRDAEAEKAKDWTDIEYLYKVNLNGTGTIRVQTIKL